MIEQRRELLLLGIRWLALLHILILYYIGFNIGSIWLFCFLLAYNLVFSYYFKNIVDNKKLLTLVIHFNLLLAVFAIWSTGIGWKSPYFMYAFGDLIIVSSYFSFSASFITIVYFCILYSFAIFNFFDKSRIHLVMQDIDSFIGNYIAFIAVTIFFGYPSFLIKQIDENNTKANIIKQCTLQAKNLVVNSFNGKILSTREQEILSYLIKGKSNAQIANELYITEQTVKNHVNRIFKKLGVRSRVELLKNYAYYQEKIDKTS